MDTAERVRRIKPSPSTAAAQRVRELKSQGHTIFDLTVGEPDFDTPGHVKAAAIEAIEAGETKYTPVNGTPRLRSAIAGKLRERHGLECADAQIAVGGGAKQVIFLALMATLDEGDEVIVPAPYWVSYPDMVRANDGTPVVVDCPEADGFKLTPERLGAAITERTRWVVLNTPGNPTGSAYTTGELHALAQVLLDHPRVSVLTDEIYDEIWYRDEDAPSLAAVQPRLAERVFLTNGVSKTYAMTGWRIGYQGPGDGDQHAAVPDLLLPLLREPGRRCRRAHRTAGLRPGNRARLPRAPRRHGEAHQRHSRSQLHRPRRRLLPPGQLPGRHGAVHPVGKPHPKRRGLRTLPARQSAGRRDPRSRVRRTRLLPHLVRHLDGRPHRGVRAPRDGVR
jgi:histidinol-phosphate/aromatic aminotransferase/cobyric acid decarboxylase-like protein